MRKFSRVAQIAAPASAGMQSVVACQGMRRHGPRSCTQPARRSSSRVSGGSRNSTSPSAVISQDRAAERDLVVLARGCVQAKTHAGGPKPGTVELL
jgi:hypothetical protein